MDTANNTVTEAAITEGSNGGEPQPSKPLARRAGSAARQAKRRSKNLPVADGTESPPGPAAEGKRKNKDSQRKYLVRIHDDPTEGGLLNVMASTPIQAVNRAWKKWAEKHQKDSVDALANVNVQSPNGNVREYTMTQTMQNPPIVVVRGGREIQFKKTRVVTPAKKNENEVASPGPTEVAPESSPNGTTPAEVAPDIATEETQMAGC